MDREKESPVQIQLTAAGDSSLLSEYWSDSPGLNPDAADFLDNEIRAYPTRRLKGLQVVIHTEDASEIEKELYPEAIHHYYSNRLCDNRIRLRRNSLSSLVMFVAGAAVLVVMAFLTKDGLDSVSVEILDIIGWVFVWQATSVFFLDRHDIRQENRRCKALSKAPVLVEPLDLNSRKVLYEEHLEAKRKETEDGSSS